MPVSTHGPMEPGLPGLQLSEGEGQNPPRGSVPESFAAATLPAGPHLLPFLRYHGLGRACPWFFMEE